MAKRVQKLDAAKRLPFATANHAVYIPVSSWRGARLLRLLGQSPRTGNQQQRALEQLEVRPDAAGAWRELATRYDALIRAGLLAPALHPKRLDALLPDALRATLTPIGVIHLYRQYLFELDTFVGTPVGHFWLSPGSSLELTESRVVHTALERTVETAYETRVQTEESQSELAELADKLATREATDSRFGVSVSASGSYGVVSASTSASVSLASATERAHELVQRTSQQRTSKTTEEQRRSVKMTVKSTREETQTQGRRYVLQNSTPATLNYELRQKMRRVSIQAQYLGSRLCWITHVQQPGTGLGMSQLVHASRPDDLLAMAGEKPRPPLVRSTTETLVYNWLMDGNVEEKGHVVLDLKEHAPEGYDITHAVFENAAEGSKYTIGWDGTQLKLFRNKGAGTGYGNWPIHITFTLRDEERKKDTLALATYEEELAAYEQRRNDSAFGAYVQAARERIKLASNLRPRPAEALRQEERIAIMRRVMSDLQAGKAGPGMGSAALSAVLAQVFDFDEVFYFVAPDWWLPRVGYAPPVQRLGEDPNPLDALTLESASSTWGENAQPQHYFLTEESEPAPLGASIGWLLQLDGDDARNAFLNSPLVRVLVPIRPGQEAAAVEWLKEIEGDSGAPSGAELDKLVGTLKKSQDQERERGQRVYQTGHQPLPASFEVGPEREDGVFAEWTEVVPTDQVVAVEMEYE